MTLVRFEPQLRFHHHHPMVGALPKSLNRIFEDFLGGDEPECCCAWTPRVEIVELKDQFEVSAELPGLTKDDVKLELQDNVLTISGEKRSQSERQDRNLFASERHFGSFRRSFQLPSGVEAKSIKAEFKNGVLTITLKKTAEAQPQQIEISEN